MNIAIHQETPDTATLRDALQRLTPETPARWGKLDAAGMLEHVARFNEFYLGRRRRPVWIVRTLARLFAGPFLKKFLEASPFDMPREMKTLPALRVEPSAVASEDFEALRARVVSTLDELEAIQGVWNHPLYGRIEADMGKGMARHHAAHHLNQFGLLERTTPGTPPSPA